MTDRATHGLAELAEQGGRALAELMQQDREGLDELSELAADGDRALRELMGERATDDAAQVHAGESSLVAREPDELRTVSADAEQLVAAWLEQYGKGNTAAAYAGDLRRWLSWCELQGWDAVHAHRVQVQRWVSELHEQGYAPSTVARRLTALRSWYGWLADESVVHASPAVRVRLLERVPSRVPSAGLSLEQAQGLLRTAEHANRRDALVVGLLLLMGLRASEVGQLDADGVRHERGHLLLTVRGKGGTVHELPVHAWLGERLTSYLHGRTSGPLLMTHSGERLTRWQVRRTVERVCKVAGLPVQVHPHTLRHAAVTLALQAGAPLHRVQDLARHASPVTTRRYDDAVGRLDGHASYALGDALAGAA
jgi:site-specific recombinase XerD